MRERTPNQAASKPSLSSPARGTKTTADKRIPKKTARLDPAASIKSFVRKILLASPMFPRLCADVLRSATPNFNESNSLASNLKKIIATTERINKAMSSKSCMHIKVTGVRCGSPALRGEQFCYFHQRMFRTVRVPASRVHQAALLEDEESIQTSLIETVNGLLRGTLELKRAELVLRALNIAVRNIRRVHFGLDPERMVKEVPDYPTPPLEEVDEAYAAELRRSEKREEIKRVYGEQLAASRAASVKAAPSTSAKAAPATAVSPASLPAPVPPPKPDQTKVPEAPPRKPPVSVKESPTRGSTKAPQARPIAAQRASSG